MHSGINTKTANILVVDDDKLTLETIKYIFQALEPGYIVETISNPLEIKNYLPDKTPDLIITDWEMPEMNGIKLIEYVRSFPHLENLPIIMATGIMTGGENLMIALNAGANDFLRKPFDKTELIARVRLMLQISNNIKEIQAQNLAIREYHSFILSLMASVPIPVVYYNIFGIIINCNKSFLETFGLTDETSVGNVVYDLCPNAREMKLFTERMLKENIKQYRFEAVFNLPQKQNATFIVSKTIFYDSQEKPEGIVCVMSDITEIKEMHKKSIEEKKRELVSSAMRMIQMSEINEKLINDLEVLSEHADNEWKSMLKQIAEKYKLKSHDTAWKEFELRFERVYEEFYKRLSVLHPFLTPGEKKLSALLRLNLSSKEIAALTFQDAKSVDMARYRIRKKINLPPDANLNNYLMEI